MSLESTIRGEQINTSAAALNVKILEAHRKLRELEAARAAAGKAYDASISSVDEAAQAVTAAERHLLAFLKGAA